MNIKELFEQNEQEFNKMLNNHQQLEQQLKELEIEMFKKQGALGMLKGMLDAESQEQLLRPWIKVFKNYQSKFYNSTNNIITGQTVHI